jgi:Putative prokaryotic signal transducing protein
MDDYVKIESADNEAMAELIRQRLDNAAIPCAVVPGDLASVAGAGARYAVSVPADQADAARQVLSAGESGS